MRILIAVPSYWPSQDGVAMITGYLAEGLAARGHEVLVYTSAGNGGLQVLPHKERHNKVDIERIRVYVRWPLKIKGRDKESTKRKYYERISSYDPDVLIVVCTQTWTFDWLKPYLDKINCPKVFYAHGYSGWEEKYDYMEKLRRRNILGVWEQYRVKSYYDSCYKYIKKYDLAIYLSEQSNSYKYAVLHRLGNGKILENAIEDAFFESDMHCKHNGEKNGKLFFLFVANYNENKNQEMLIRAFGKAKIKNSGLLLVGFERNEYLNHLEQVASEVIDPAEGKEVVFNVHLKRKQVVELYRKADVFVCSSKSEIYPIVAHEAAAAAMPIISTDVGIYSQIDGCTIVNDVEEMADAMEGLYYDPEKRKAMGEAAYNWLCTRQCRIEDKVEWLEKSLQQLL